MDNIDNLADVGTARMDEDQPTNSAQVDECIARLLQTVKEVNDTIAKPSSPKADEEPGTIGDNNSESSELDSSSSDSDMEDESEDDRTNMLKMIAEGDDDDEDQLPNNSVPVTRNEVLDPQIPELTMTELPDTAQLTSLGAIHSIVANSVIIQAHISGERHVLDSESVLCFDDRRVLGLVYDVFGPVSRPMYTVRFRGEIDPSQVVVGRRVFFSPGWVRMLVTEKLRVRGTDASNEYDEEVGEDGMEFSDDEEELMHRRKAKKARQLAAQNRAQNAGAAAPQSAAAVPPLAVADATAAPQNARKLQSYQDLYDADLGF
ncbi:hypothetical protein IWW39_002042 [Coemansia spiralis]|uniref:H/ACA ribonucleoprotein complex subunit n=1 Tax=Coemansia spiralis TaxID=417178 RepID=A0A9W8GLP0_9FUNG|nr:hypothetical protein IWW39_002042 [Coemansia spiralis]